ncbi:hypothetical protein GPECTOR_159g109 [Gonium pectorale]|uniref:Uncharacterized protein n=1 Tax=Gonium pectorale TaxID=33097 RepID=A0A150FXJ7_GONPE|nr:hypothetical protein GPECTOR_159g109 [Gonium pectorale]|eukprot:KXZ42341.1 hypothetical protein GPECTOR_159g109 [Gonium pectorale]
MSAEAINAVTGALCDALSKAPSFDDEVESLHSEVQAFGLAQSTSSDHLILLNSIRDIAFMGLAGALGVHSSTKGIVERTVIKVTAAVVKLVVEHLRTAENRYGIFYDPLITFEKAGERTVPVVIPLGRL